MENNEEVSTFFNRVHALTNRMKGCVEKLSDQATVEKVLRSLSIKFDCIVVSIEEPKDLASMKVEELQASLEAHEQRMNERSSDRRNNQPLQAHTSKKNNSDKWKAKNKGKDGAGSSKNQDQSRNNNHDQPESSNQNINSNSKKHEKKKFNKR